VDALLLGLEYFLVKWLIKKWNEWESGQGPPVARCQQLNGPPPFSGFQQGPGYVFELTTAYYNERMSRAVNGGQNYAKFDLVAVNTDYYPEWKGWNWHVEVYAKGSSIGATYADNCYLWNVICPTKHFKKWSHGGIHYGSDPDGNYDKQGVQALVCGCPEGGCTSSTCIWNANEGGHQVGVFYVFYTSFKNDYGKLTGNTCPCLGQCGAGSGAKSTCKDYTC
jgi:hypothetical protein